MTGPFDADYQYQTRQRDCSLRWDAFGLSGWVPGKRVLDLGCAEGWFVERALDAGAASAVGVDTNDLPRAGKGTYRLADAHDPHGTADVVILLSVPLGLEVVGGIAATGAERVFFEPYRDDERKSPWTEVEWLRRFGEYGYEPILVATSERGRGLYNLRRTTLRMVLTADGRREAVKPLDPREVAYYRHMEDTPYALPFQTEEGLLILPWAEGTLRLDGTMEHVAQVEEAVDFLHRQGYVHGDIRVGNVVLWRGRAYLMDPQWWHRGAPAEDETPTRGVAYLRRCVQEGALRARE